MMRKSKFGLLIVAMVLLLGIATMPALANELLLADDFEFTGPNTGDLQKDQDARQTGTLAPNGGSLLPTAWGTDTGWAELRDVAGFGRSLVTNSWLGEPTYNAYNFNGYDHLLISVDYRSDAESGGCWGYFFVGTKTGNYTASDRLTTWVYDAGNIGVKDGDVTVGSGTYTPGATGGNVNIEYEIVKGPTSTLWSVAIDGTPVVVDHVVAADLSDMYIGFAVHAVVHKIDNLSVTLIPEPATMSLLVIGAVVAVVRRKR